MRASVERSPLARQLLCSTLRLQSCVARKRAVVLRVRLALTSASRAPISMVTRAGVFPQPVSRSDEMVGRRLDGDTEPVNGGRGRLGGVGASSAGVGAGSPATMTLACNCNRRAHDNS